VVVIAHEEVPMTRTVHVRRPAAAAAAVPIVVGLLAAGVAVARPAAAAPAPAPTMSTPAPGPPPTRSLPVSTPTAAPAPTASPSLGDIDTPDAPNQPAPGDLDPGGSADTGPVGSCPALRPFPVADILVPETIGLSETTALRLDRSSGVIVTQRVELSRVSSSSPWSVTVVLGPPSPDAVMQLAHLPLGDYEVTLEVEDCGGGTDTVTQAFSVIWA
jgi:hypothetical protein